MDAGLLINPVFLDVEMVGGDPSIDACEEESRDRDFVLPSSPACRSPHQRRRDRLWTRWATSKPGRTPDNVLPLGMYDWKGKRDDCYRLYVEERKSLDEVASFWAAKRFTPR
jgi:hypothetical protein